MEKLRQRNLPLDLLRIFAALWVMTFHWSGRGGFFPLLTTKPDLNMVPSSLQTFSSWGFLGVDIFFILSGAVIAKSALNNSWNVFARARFLRLFPVYFMASAVAIVVIPISTSRIFSVNDLFSLSGLQFWIGGPTPLGTAWTLPIEISFYGLVALAIWLATRHGHFKLDNLKTFLDTWMLLYIVSIPMGFAPLQFLLVPTFAPYFILGAIAINISSFMELKENALRLIVALVMSVKVIFLRIETDIHLQNKFFMSIFIVVVCTLIIVLSSTFESKVKNTQLGNFTGTLALMTYPIYLLHEQIGLSLISVLLRMNNSVVISYLVSLATIFFTSWLLVRFIEPKIKTLLKNSIFNT